MTDLELKVKLTREMNSKDYCHQRIFSCIPLLWLIYGNYMTVSKNYDFSSVFFNVVKDWNKERNIDIIEKFDKNKCSAAIDELIEFYEIICNIYNNYNNNNIIDIELLNKLQQVSLEHYKDLSTLCRIYVKKDNRSKIICRLSTLKKKLNKFFNGVISPSKFIEEEILPQKDFLDTFILRLSLFEKNQFCIFMLCYDLRKSNETIFVKTRYDDMIHFLI